MNPEDGTQVNNTTDVLAPYFPDYLGGTVTTTIQLVLFHAFLLVFVIKLVKWSGRAWLMGWTFCKSREVRLVDYDISKRGIVSVGWDDQAGPTVRKAFRDWCWPSVPTASTPLQNWIDRMANEIDELSEKDLLTGKSPIHRDEDLQGSMSGIIAELSHYLEPQFDGKSHLDDWGLSVHGKFIVTRVRDSLRERYNEIEGIISNPNISHPDKIERCNRYVSFAVQQGDRLRSVARYGRLPDYRG